MTRTSWAGRPPSDPAKRALYDAQKAAALGMAPKTHPRPSQTLVAPVIPATSPTTVHLSDAQVLQMVASKFETFFTLTRAATTGTVRSAFVIGAPGVGKTYTAERILEHAHEAQGLRYNVIQGVVTPIHLYRTLYENRAEPENGKEKRTVLIFDDCDGIFADESALNILKAGTDTKQRRMVQWHSESNMLKKDEIPSSFEFRASVIFITNLNLLDLANRGKGSNIAHIKALLDRGQVLDLKLHDRRAISLWVNHLVAKNHILVSQCGVTHDQQTMLMKWLTAKAQQTTTLSVRTAIKLGEAFQMDPKNWEALATDLLM